MNTSTADTAVATFSKTIPIFRIFDIDKAKEFYIDYLGCTVDWEHRFEPGLPLYMQVSRNGLTVHLSEHYGDATPGSTSLVHMTGLDALQAELGAKPPGCPAIKKESWGRMMQLLDPFGNRLRLIENIDG